MRKTLELEASAIRELARQCRACIASDRITVDGQPVGFMYRETPDNERDSGWRLLAGDESPEYLRDPDNLALYDVDTLARYDRDIIPLLGAPIGAAFERNAKGRLVVTEAPPPEET